VCSELYAIKFHPTIRKIFYILLVIMKITFKKDNKTIDSLESWEKNGGPKLNKQWQEGHSAHEMAYYAIEHTDEFVRTIQSVLKSCGLQQQDFVCELEATIGLGQGMKRGGPRVHDLLMIGEDCVIGIEAKVLEPFGENISSVNKKQKEKSKETRAEALWDFLAGKNTTIGESPIGYQLFTATRGTMCSALKAKKVNCIMLVLSFIPEAKDKKAKDKNEEDYKSFLDVIDADPNDMIIRTIENKEIKSWLRMEHVNISK
jgi:hypothetical protein